MEHHRLETMTGGWFIGNFTPSVLRTSGAEVAVKHYSAGAIERMHFHKVATEITLIVSGRVRMLDREWSRGDILVLSPGEATDFRAVTDAVNVVVKIPSTLEDKYFLDEGSLDG